MNSRTRLLAAPLLELGPQDGPGVILGISLGDRVNGLGLCSTCPRHDIVPSRWAPTACASCRETCDDSWGVLGNAGKPATRAKARNNDCSPWRAKARCCPRCRGARGLAATRFVPPARRAVARRAGHDRTRFAAPHLFLKRSPCHAQRTQPKDSGSPLRPADRPVILRGVSATAGPRGRCIARKILVDMRIAAY